MFQLVAAVAVMTAMVVLSFRVVAAAAAAEEVQRIGSSDASRRGSCRHGCN